MAKRVKTQFKTGRRKTGGRKKGTLNKKTVEKKLRDHFLEVTQESYNTYEELLTMPQEKFVALATPEKMAKMPMHKVMAMRTVRQAVIEEDLSARLFIQKSILGEPSRFIGMDTISIDGEIGDLDDASVEINIDWLIKWTVARVRNYEGHPDHLRQFLDVVRHLADLIEKKTSNEYKRQNTVTSKELNSLLDSISDALIGEFSAEPDRFERIKDAIVERIQSTPIYGRVIEIEDQRNS